jgi:hypothetical protein
LLNNNEAQILQGRLSVEWPTCQKSIPLDWKQRWDQIKSNNQSFESSLNIRFINIANENNWK